MLFRSVLMLRILISQLFFLFCFFPYVFADSYKGKPLKVGFIGSFSGPAQVYGDSAKNGFELALDELGRDWIKVYYEDDQFKPSLTVSAFNKLANINKVDLLISVGSTPSNAIAPLAQSRRIPLIAWASDRKVSLNRSFVFRSYPSGYAEGKAAAIEAKRRQYDKFAVFTTQNDYIQSWKNGFKENVTQASIVFEEEVSVEELDFKTTLLRAKNAGAKQIAICLNPGQSGTIARQASEIELKASFFGCEYLHNGDEVKSAHGALDDAWFATISVTDAFKHKYLNRFGNENVISGAANHFDIAHLLHKIVMDQGSEKLSSSIASSSISGGAVGDFVVRAMKGDQFFDIPLIIKEVSPN